MQGQKIRRVVIAGGGTAGWCAAAALSKLIGPLIDITLIESEEIGIVGVGEATIPTARTFHHFLGIDERAFLKASNATYKLGIAFENWGREGDRYIHSFGEIGKSNWMAPFHHVWMAARDKGFGGDLSDYCFELQAAEQGRFFTSDTARINYAYHFDAVLYGRFLRQFSEANGVRRIEGRIRHVQQDAESGFITALDLESGETVEGDLFIDCTGFKGLLIEETLKTGFEDWSHWLPTDRALAVQTASAGRLDPYTRAIAHGEGWRWRIPLQNRVGNGLVYSSAHLSDEAARERLMGMLDAEPLTEPRLIRYRTGRRRQIWNRNCLTLGLSSGFIEPLESTSIHLFQVAVTRLIQLFPFGGITEALTAHYNELARREIEKVRDFVVLHYKLTERDDSDFWRERRDMAVPDSLSERIEMFREHAHAWQASDDLFRVDSWVQVLRGQRLEPRSHHGIGDLMGETQLRQALESLRQNIARTVAAMPTHEAFLKSYLGN